MVKFEGVVFQNAPDRTAPSMNLSWSSVPLRNPLNILSALVVLLAGVKNAFSDCKIALTVGRALIDKLKQTFQDTG
jgi:hypothetical protein